MKIEKVNDNQIRCTLTKEDLADRQLKLSELAYGTEKAKVLFRDMMQQAAYEFGFEAEDIPLMIEAIPLSADTIILIITKVEYPEEIDTRFSKFSEGDESDFDSYSQEDGSGVALEGADDILGLYRKMQEERQKAEQELKQSADFVPLEATFSNKEQEVPEKNDAKKEPVDVFTDITKLFVFQNLDNVTRLAHVLNGFYHDQNDLYKNPANKKFYLVIHKGKHTPEDFNKVCNILSEYGSGRAFSAAGEAHLKEHGELISNIIFRGIAMIYTVKRIDEDLDFGCEERLDDAPVMAIVTLVDSSGKEVTVKAEDAKLYERNINEGDKVCLDVNNKLEKVE